MFGPILAVTLIASTPRPNTLLGLWETATTTQGGIGNTLEFRPDGTFLEAPSVIVDMHYRVVGDHLLIAEQPPAAAAETSQSPTIRIDGNVMVQTAPNGTVIRKERLGSPEPDRAAIIGVWRYRHYTGAIAFERYAVDGTMSFRLPMASSPGRYVLNDHELTLTPSGKNAVRVKIEIAGEQLLFSESPERTTTYRRAVGGPWYDREHIDHEQTK